MNPEDRSLLDQCLAAIAAAEALFFKSDLADAPDLEKLATGADRAARASPLAPGCPSPRLGDALITRSPLIVLDAGRAGRGPSAGTTGASRSTRFRGRSRVILRRTCGPDHRSRSALPDPRN
ncbi:hypothetical protein LAZ29_01030 [Cereibacter sphaeroides]|uniref:hypothetical protein n=1 Tax=Cereibacter sphaeroides TaxID=1063 RepID=UPI001F48A77F|nr:hypothetical protein [Cereibacter sphaeroides]MCE6949533.1 hypothetical protein [Cereibacter sphaeroides]